MQRLDWQRVEAVFARAQELPLAERAALLEVECGGDAALRAEVESLLAHSAATEFLERPLTGDLGRMLQSLVGLDGALVGASLCGYRLEGVVGSGGMGTVYRGRTREGAAVAVKVLKAAMATEAARQRFAAECEVLGSLQHPSIARLLDCGLTEDGLPFAVMEFVDGVPITEACDRAALSVVERLRLFLDVCAAVQHAHRNMVVHRDLKPGNVLVDAARVPHLVDFGIAKVLPREPAADRVVSTRLLTPEYTSPEQIRGEPTTIASDVYALGVMLYELLTGQRPYAFSSYDPRELARVVGEVAPLPPSQAVSRADASSADLCAVQRGTTVPRLARALAGDLDNVVLCALRKEPHRRYATVERFADDLARYLDGRPVAARGDSLRYRALKFVRRHRFGLAAATVTSAALLLGGVGIWWQRTLAREEAASARRITDLLLDTFAAAEPGETSYGNARALVDRAAAHVDAYHLQGLTRATLLQSLGRIYQNLGERPAAEVRYREALRLREAELGRIHVDTAATLTQLASLLTDTDRFDEAESLLADALRAARAAPTGEVLVRALDTLGTLRSARGRHVEAVAAFEEALALAQRLFGPTHPVLASTMNNFGVDCWRSGDLARAGELLRQALALRMEHPQGQQTRIALLHHNLGVLALAQGDFVGAQPLLERALELRERIFTPTHRHVAHTLHALGELHLQRRTPQTAEPLLRRCLAIQRAAMPADWRTHETMSTLAACLLDLDRPAEAELLLREALPVIEGALPEDHEHVREARQRWARCAAMTSGSSGR